MYIDTHSYKDMERGICDYFQTDKEKLLELFNNLASKANANGYCDELIIWSGFDNFIEENEPEEKIDELLFFHLTRRLEGTEESVCSNMKELLTTENPFADFLKKHEFMFQVDDEGKIVIYKNGVLMSLKDEAYNSYFRKRLGYAGEGDLCINGFAFGDCLKENQYMDSLSQAPEIIEQLQWRFGADKLLLDYYKNSKFYIYDYKLPLKEVIFDMDPRKDEEQKRQTFLEMALYRLYYYMLDGELINDKDNIALRIDDGMNMKGEWYLGRRLYCK